ncbi:MAG TPA: CHRD domain-containing protein [Phycisphaerae bacterium]|nr:CHRD domain-containing protein [Phycisphaerae bacterium]
MRGRFVWKSYLVTVLSALAAAGIATAATHEVIVRNFEFDPADITVAPGDTVRWVWESGSHTVTSGTDCTYDELYFDDPMTSGDPDFEFVIPDDVAEIPYFCRPHCFLGMVGLITVDLDAVDFVITLDGDQEVPAADTTATASGTATLLPSTNQFSWEITFSGLEGSEAAAHFHGPAPQCQNAGVQITLPLGSPKVGSATLTEQQVADLLAGLWYVNIHTDIHPPGEIRGQVMPGPLTNPIPDVIAAGDLHIQLETVATGLTAPNWGTFAPGDTDRLFVTDQDGTLWAIDLDTGTKDVFLDVSARLVELGVFGPDSFDERGLLGVAFHPDYLSNGLLYTYTSEPVAGEADFSTMPFGFDPNHQTVILEWQVPNPADENSVVDPNSARELLRIDEPQFNHNAGAMTFGPDGQLYIVLGDGGARDDKDGGPPVVGDPVVGHGCIGNGQDTDTILGTLIRIDPLGNNSRNGQYGIPGDNPFVGLDGLDEIYAYGFRNPFRFSFDSLTGNLYVGDVGQNDIEEIDLVVSGGNYGWNYKEGTFFFVANGNEPGYVTDMPLDVPGGLIDPIGPSMTTTRASPSSADSSTAAAGLPRLAVATFSATSRRPSATTGDCSTSTRPTHSASSRSWTKPNWDCRCSASGRTPRVRSTSSPTEPARRSATRASSCISDYAPAISPAMAAWISPTWGSCWQPG